MGIRSRVLLVAAAAAWAAIARPAAQPAVLPAPGSQDAPRVSQAVQERLSRGERVRVLVELRRPASSGFPGVASDAARAALAAAQEQFIARVPHHGQARALEHLPLVALDVDATALPALLSSPDVARVRVDELRRPSLTESVPLIGAPTAWSAGATGAGWAVAVLDTGVDKTHDFLAGKVVSEACYSTSSGTATSVCPGGLNSTAAGSGVPCSAAVAGCSHGTRVAGIAAGKGTTFSGVAKDASIIAIQVYSRIDDAGFCSPDPSPCVGAFDSDILAGLARVHALRTSFNIASALVALGSGSYTSACDTAVPEYKTAIDQLRAAGIATVTSSGNDGFTNAMHEPACVSTAISVGASTKSDTLAAYTNRNAGLSLLAPGSAIYSPTPAGFSFANGTSMAAAHVAGAWAIMKDHNPAADVSTVLSALKATAVPVADPANGINRPRINVGAAVATSQEFDPLRWELPDFDGTGTHDLFWRSLTTPGNHAIWLMSNGAIASSAVFGASTSWNITGTGDFNGDGRSDILWRSPTTGALAIWFMNGGAVQSTAVMGVGSGWDLVGEGDLNGDGRTDLLWRRISDGALAIWFMNGGTTQSTAVFGVGGGWDLVGNRDLNGDGRTDLLWRSQANGALAIWFMNGATVQSTAVLGVGAGWALVAAGDNNGDGRADLQWRNTTTGTLAIWFMNGATTQSTAVFGLGTEWTLVGTGDVNGDGKHDLAFRRASDGFLVIWLMNGATMAGSKNFGVGTGWTPVGPS